MGVATQVKGAMAATLDYGTVKEAILFLGTAGVVIPLFHRLRVSPVLGFLLMGVLVGPYGFGRLQQDVPWLTHVTVGKREEIALIAEFGVVFLLFVIGLELSLARLITMRRLVFGLGSLQVVISGVVIAGVAAFFGNPPAAAAVIGACLALSSTAIVVEELARRKRLATATGRASFSVLLLQDLAVVPILFMVAVLGARTQGSLAGGLAIAIGEAGLAIAAIVLIGRRLLRPFFRMVAHTESPELFVAATLFVTVGTGLVAQAAGLSMALGAFVAGLLLAETEFRREIAVTMEPFKGLLLGLFFFSVGIAVDVGAILRDPFWIIASAVGLVVIKAGLIFGLARAFGVARPAAAETALLLGPGGEFAFVVIWLAVSLAIVPYDVAQFMLVVTSLSMIALPVIARVAEALAPRLQQRDDLDPEAAAMPPTDDAPRAIVVGFGRVGQLVAEMLETHGVPYIATDRNPSLVAGERRQGKPVYFGDATRREFLRHCGIAHARALIVTIDAPSNVDEIVRQARSLRPDLLIVARARDAKHAGHLYAIGASDAVPETIEASLQLAEAALTDLGVPMGHVIASVHEKRDQFRTALRAAETPEGRIARLAGKGEA
jgi:CPA2 family monovalent cation:H+ antiporter-2